MQRAAWSVFLIGTATPLRIIGKSLDFACMIFDFTFVCYNTELRGKRIDHEVLFKKAFPFIVRTNGMREK